VTAAGVALGLLCSSADANTADLTAFLERTERMAAFTGAVRADIRISRGGTVVDEAVVVVDSKAARAFIAQKSSGWRALVPLGWNSGTAAKPGAKPGPFAADEPIPGTDLRAIDFTPFWKGDYANAFISDANRLEKTITLYPAKQLPYVLFVVTFDKEKLVPLTSKFYRENMNNLVRLRRDSDFAMVGSRPRPRHVEIQDFAENTSTVLDISWQTLETVPAGLTDDTAFQKTEIAWPSAAPPPAN
jgi:hypothetical protein